MGNKMADIPLFVPSFKSNIGVQSDGPGRRKRKRDQRNSPAATQQQRGESISVTTQLSGSLWGIISDTNGDRSPKPELWEGSSRNREDSWTAWEKGNLFSHTGLHKHHLAVLTAIMHRNMLEGDYLRAGRAWGMLLRAELNGHPMDLRPHGLWGVGAEILLFRDGQLANDNAQELDDLEIASSKGAASADNRSDALHASTFSEDGFLMAKQYYERLILQYPYRKTAPMVVSSVDFYPAMFGLWIYLVQGQAQGQIRSNSAREEPKGARDMVQAVNNPRIKRSQALDQASQIGARMDELLVSPPYSDHARLWNLRGNVALWEADLLHESIVSIIASTFVGDNPDLEDQQKNAESKAKDAFATASRLQLDKFIARSPSNPS